VEYHWCTYHKLWQKHKAVDCRMNPANKSDGKKAEDKKDERAEGNNEGGNNNRPRVTFAPTSNIAVVHSEDDF
jgi:hypothetical protein